jgi:IS5 family transposase
MPRGIAAAKLLRWRKLRIDTTAAEACIDHPQTLTCWSTGAEMAGASDHGQWRRPSHLFSGTLSRPPPEADLPHAESAHWPGAGRDRPAHRRGRRRRSATLQDVAAVERNARHAQPSGRLAHLVSELTETVAGTRRLLEQTALRLAARDSRGQRRGYG